MCRIEAGSRQVPESSDSLPLIRRSNCIAAIFDHPEIVLRSKRHNIVKCKRVTQSVCQDDSLGPWRERIFKVCSVDVVSGYLHIHEDRNKPISNDWIDGGRKACSDCDHLVSWAELPFSQ